MLRRRMMMAQGGVSLPVGYTKIEYLESDGNSYIDTLYKPNSNTRVVFEGYNNSTSSGWIFGTWKAVNDNMFCASAVRNYNICYGTEIWKIATMPVGPISIDINKNAYTYNGVSGTLSEQAFSCDYTMYLFHINAAGSVSSGKFNGKIYSVKIYDNGTLVRDFIPCTNPDGISGLWDSVNDVFYKLLPADYTKLDFIESDGNHYIDTGFKPNQDTRVIMDVQLLTANPTIYQGVFGGRSGNTNQLWVLYHYTENAWAFRFGNNPTNHYISAGATDRVTIDTNANTMTIGDTSVTATAATFTSAYTMWLLAFNNAGATEYPSGPARLYSCQIYDNGTLVRDFIPAMNASGEAGLYDLKNDAWYALLTAVKPKVENKLIFREQYDYDYEMWVGWVDATYSPKTRLTVKIMTSYGPSTVSISEGSLKSNSISGYSDSPYITSISPTEDDTYIYTF